MPMLLPLSPSLPPRLQGQNWISVLSILAHGARIGFQYSQFWPMGRELTVLKSNSGPVVEEAEFCGEIE